MKFILVLATIAALLMICSADKKKSLFNVPWPGYPFNRPPQNYFPPHDPEYYENYDLGDDETDDSDDFPDTKPDYKSSTAFKAGIASALHDFTFNLYRTMIANKTEGNIVISPLSVYTALSMLTLGLGGNSESQALSVLHGDAFDDIHQDMSELSDAIFDSPRVDVTLDKANRIYVDRSIRLLKAFKRTMKSDYHVSAKKVNFVQAPGLNRRRINHFVSRHTNHRIENLAPEGSITADTRLFIVNAMYMKAFWRTPFSDTEQAKFFVTPEKAITTELMSTIGPCAFEVDNVLRARIVRNQLKGDLSMVMIIPNQVGDFSNLEDERGSVRIRRALESIYTSTEPSGWMPSCHIKMPKFKIEHSADDLVECLTKMGMPDVFNPSRADLSKMSPQHGNLYVSDMRHKATIDVNEQGIEGAAATSVVIVARMMPQMVHIDRPFLFIVRDDITGATLFTGKVIRPSYE